jgi:HEAT repeat protein
MVGRIGTALIPGLLLVSTAAAGDKADEAIARAIPNLLVALGSDNVGLRESAAYYLGEYKSDEAVIPLMRLLRDSDLESTRIVAALALSRIGDPLGAYAVKRAATFDDNAKVRTLCAWYYNQYYEPGSFAFVGTGEVPPTLAQEQKK